MKKMKKAIAIALVAAVSLTMMFGCGAKKQEPAPAPAEKIDMNIAALKGPTIIGMTKLLVDSEAGETANTYNFTVAGAADEITGAIVKGEIDIAAVPANLAAVLYNKTEGKVGIAAINTLGVLYVLENGDSVQSVADLAGKTIYTTGQGTTPEYTLNYMLRANGLDPEKDVTIEFKSEAPEVVSALVKGEAEVGMLPQPQVTAAMMQKEGLRVALDVTQEWEAVADNGSTVTTGVVLVNKSFAEAHPDAVAAFLEEYAASAEWVNANPADAGAALEAKELFKAALITKAIPACNITFITGDEMKTKVSGYLQALYDQNPKAVGGAMPSDDFYLTF